MISGRLAILLAGVKFSNYTRFSRIGSKSGIPKGMVVGNRKIRRPGRNVVFGGIFFENVDRVCKLDDKKRDRSHDHPGAMDI